jgi:DNA repair protein RecO (recombination protein O)
MPEQASEAIVLRTYPLRESDLIVSFFTRDQGKLRGVAHRARRPKGGFGSSLERLSLVRIRYSAHENRELVRINGCDLLQSQFELASDYRCGVALDVMAEIAEYLLPPHETNERYFRLLVSVLDHLRRAGGNGLWLAVTYFEWWSVRLGGFLPDMPLSEASAALQEKLRTSPIAALPVENCGRAETADLRRRLASLIEAHIERRLLAVPLLEGIE